MFTETCPIGKKAASISKDFKSSTARRSEHIRDLFGDTTPSDLTIFEYLRSGGDVHILHAIVGEDVVRMTQRRVVEYIKQAPHS
jgi:hypothetical protein